jgi:hypothetical protein
MLTLSITVIAFIVFYNIYLSTLSKKRVPTHSNYSYSKNGESLFDIISRWIWKIVAIIIFLVVLAVVWAVGELIYDVLYAISGHHRTEEPIKDKDTGDIIKAEDILPGTWNVRCGKKNMGVISYKKDGTLLSNWNHTKHTGTWRAKGDRLYIRLKGGSLIKYDIVEIDNNYYQVEKYRLRCQAIRINYKLTY